MESGKVRDTYLKKAFEVREFYSTKNFTDLFNLINMKLEIIEKLSQ